MRELIKISLNVVTAAFLGGRKQALIEWNGNDESAEESGKEKILFGATDLDASKHDTRTAGFKGTPQERGPTSHEDRSLGGRKQALVKSNGNGESAEESGKEKILFGATDLDASKHDTRTEGFKGTPQERGPTSHEDRSLGRGKQALVKSNGNGESAEESEKALYSSKQLVQSATNSLEKGSQRTLRTPVEIRNACPQGQNAIPDDMKSGFFETKEEAIAYYQKYASDPRLGNGVFWLVKKNGERAASTRRGKCFSLFCDHEGKPRDEGKGERMSVSRKCGCHYALHFEESTEGFYLSRGTFTHSGHEPTQDKVAALANANLRGIPEQLIELADTLHKTGSRPGYIHHTLVKKAAMEGLEETWNAQDIANRYRQTPEQKALDPSGMIGYLQSRGEPYDIKVNLENFIEGTFFVMPDALKKWAEGDFCAPIFFDTTFGTNRYQHKLACLCTISGEGDTVILASAILAYETTDAFEWCFKCWLKFFKAEPVIIFTDGDQQMATAIRNIWPSTKHRLCCWHIFQNVKENLFQCFGSTDAWDKFVDQFWKVVQTTDIQTKVDWEEDWTQLENLLKQEKFDSEERKEKKVEWLSKLGKEKGEKFAYRFGWDFFSAGAQSTQRSEAIHSALNSFIIQNSMMTQLVQSLDLYCSQKCRSKQMRSPRDILKRKTAHLKVSMSPQIEELSKTDNISGYALQHLLAQHNQRDHYISEEVTLATSSSRNSRKVNSKYMRPQQLTTAALPSIPGEHVYTVTRYTEKASDHVSADSDGVFNGSVGLDKDEFVKHVTSELACTCNYHTMMGLPCRHTLHVHSKVNIKSFSDLPLVHNPINPFWRQKSKKGLDLSYHTFLNLAAPTENKISKPLPLSDAERYSLLLSAFRCKIAELASKKEPLYEVAMAGIDDLSKRIVKKASGKQGKKAKSVVVVDADKSLQSKAEDKQPIAFVDNNPKRSGKQASKRKKSRFEKKGKAKKKRTEKK